ncbi:hypothetical protein AAFF_G00248080 [Aldrovandia affinis]|uniref:Uncharacterized protein n=1 Tax=Aldrovandia affinis TaxID=143900 RepID=A0AAD7W2U0_9TELE|nr:hypothetical protein AAFF_G00248080 [Aldrovandia affinis]
MLLRSTAVPLGILQIERSKPRYGGYGSLLYLFGFSLGRVVSVRPRSRSCAAPDPTEEMQANGASNSGIDLVRPEPCVPRKPRSLAQIRSQQVARGYFNERWARDSFTAVLANTHSKISKARGPSHDTSYRHQRTWRIQT